MEITGFLLNILSSGVEPLWPRHGIPEQDLEEVSFISKVDHGDNPLRGLCSVPNLSGPRDMPKQRLCVLIPLPVSTACSNPETRNRIRHARPPPLRPVLPLHCQTLLPFRWSGHARPIEPLFFIWACTVNFVFLSPLNDKPHDRNLSFRDLLCPMVMALFAVPLGVFATVAPQNRWHGL